MKKYDNFCSALHNLKDIYDYSEPYSNVVMTGLVGLYEICFEQSWKAMKEFLEKDGLYRLPVTCLCKGWLVARVDNGGAFVDIEVRGRTI